MKHPTEYVVLAVRRLVRHEDGQDLLEYALLCGLIALIAFAAVNQVGQTIYNIFWVKIGAASF